MDNPFLKRIHEGSISTEDELKTLFRKSAKDLHPDTSPFTREPAAFTRLNAHYEEALEWLKAHRNLEDAAGQPVRERPHESGAARPPPHPDPVQTGSPPHRHPDPVQTGARLHRHPDPAASAATAEPAGAAHRRDPDQARFDFYLSLQNLIARTWPFTRGREEKDASLRRHVETAAVAWDAWQPGEPGLFSRIEACRREKLSVPGGPATSDLSVWQAVEAFLFTAAGAGIEASPLNRGLLDHQSKEARLKLGRRSGTDDISRLLGMLMEDLASRTPV